MSDGSGTPASAWALGLATVTEAGGRALEAFFPEPRLGRDGAPHEDGTRPADDSGPLARAAGRDERRGVRSVPVATVIADLARPPALVRPLPRRPRHVHRPGGPGGGGGGAAPLPGGGGAAPGAGRGQVPAH